MRESSFFGGAARTAFLDLDRHRREGQDILGDAAQIGLRDEAISLAGDGPLAGVENALEHVVVSLIEARF